MSKITIGIASSLLVTLFLKGKELKFDLIDKTLIAFYILIVISTIFSMDIIKSILENPNLLDFSLEYVNSNVFEFNKNEFDCLINGDKDDKNLIGIMLNQSIRTLDGDDFQNQLRLFIINCGI